MKNQNLLKIVLFSLREVVRLHARCEACIEAMEKLRETHPELDQLNSSASEKEHWHSFLKRIEDIDPEIASYLDSRTDEDF